MFWCCRARPAFKCCLQDVEFLQIGHSSDLRCSLNLSYTKYSELCCASFFYCVIRRPQSLTLFDVVHYSQTPSNRESWGGLSQSKFKLHCCTAQWQHFQNLVVYIYKNLLFRGEIVIIQVFDQDKIAITSLLWRRL